MNTIYAVKSGEYEKDPFTGEMIDKYVCFYPDEKELAEKFADENGQDIEEWLVPFRDYHELNFYSNNMK